MLDPYVKDVLVSVAVASGLHLALGSALRSAYSTTPDLKGWPHFTYIHGLLHMGVVLPAFLAYFALHTGGDRTAVAAWLVHDDAAGGGSVGVGAEQWVQTVNIGCVLSEWPTSLT